MAAYRRAGKYATKPGMEGRSGMGQRGFWTRLKGSAARRYPLRQMAVQCLGGNGCITGPYPFAFRYLAGFLTVFSDCSLVRGTRLHTVCAGTREIR